VDVEVSFQVGPQFRLREVEVAGDIILTDNELGRVLPIEPGDPVDPYKVVLAAKELLETYRNLGFLNASLPLTEGELMKVDYENNLVDVRYDLNPGAQVLVGEIAIQGPRKTKDGVILRELRLEGVEPGKPWSPEALRKSEQSLSQLGLFGTVKFEPVGGKVLSQNYGEKISLDLQEKDLRISITESAPGSIEFGPGYRTDLGVVGFAELNYRNLMGLNRGVNLRAQVSRKILNYQFLEQKYSAAYLEPFLFGYNLRFRTSLGYIKEDQTVFVDNVATSGFNSDEISLGFAVDKSFSDEVRLTHRLYEISRPRIYDIVDRENFEPDTESYKIGSFGTSLYYDSRNNFFNPSRGWFLSASYDFAPRYLGTDSDASYLLFKQTVNRYFSLGRDGAVLAATLSYSHIWGLGQSAGIPENKRLVLGGRTSIRSLAEQSVRFDGAGLTEQNSIEGKIELRQPVVFDFGVAFFADIGEVRALRYLDSDLTERSGVQAALGFGIRYATAVGPLSLDFAVNPNAKDEQQPFRLQFSIGSF
jgi:outer membrane protein insertion porin family